MDETTLTDDDVATLRNWIRQQEIGSEVTDVRPLAGGTQNIVVGMRVDGRPMVMRRPPAHPRPTSDKTMQREIAALRTMAIFLRVNMELAGLAALLNDWKEETHAGQREHRTEPSLRAA